MFPLLDLGYEPDDLMVKVSELMVATADGADADIDGSVLEVLRLLREKMHMDVVFVSEFVDGQRVFRGVDSAPDQAPVLATGDSGPLEESWCQQVVDGRMPPYIADASKEPTTAALEQALSSPNGGIEVVEVRVRRDNRRELDARIRALGQA